MLHGIRRPFAIRRVLFSVNCSAVTENTVWAIQAIGQTLTKWNPVGLGVYMFMENWNLFGRKSALSVQELNDNMQPFIPLLPHSANSPTLQETHLLFEIYLLISICFSWFAIVPQFSPWVIPAFQWLRRSKVFGFQFKWPSKKHHGLPAVSLGM